MGRLWVHTRYLGLQIRISTLLSKEFAFKKKSLKKTKTIKFPVLEIKEVSIFGGYLKLLLFTQI